MSTTDNSQLPSSPPVLFDDFGQSCFTSKEEYKDALVKQQEKLFHVQQSYFHQKKRALIVFEGWDASGKGGACTVAPAVFSGSSGMMWGLRQSCASDLVGTRLLLSLWVVQITHSREALAWD